MPRKRSKRRSTKRRGKLWSHFRRGIGSPVVKRSVLVLGAVAVVGAAWLVWPYWELTGQFGDLPSKRPSRLYSRSLILTQGEPARLSTVESYLRETSYRTSENSSPARGMYRVDAGRLLIHLRSFPSPQGWTRPGLLRVDLRGNRVRSLHFEEQRVQRVALEPVVLTSIYGTDFKERRPIRVENLPEFFVDAVLAAEDARFFSHSGLSPRGILRAAWVNLRGGAVHQGGSTLTQQLAKNLYLTQERTLARKLREVLLAIMLETRYSKRAILAAYLNEIYWGNDGRVNIMGVGAAAHHYYGKDATQLTLAEAALLAGMIQSPGTYSPQKMPERARQRRDWVLARMVELGNIDGPTKDRAQAQPIDVRSRESSARIAAYFAEAAVREAEARFDLTELADRGYVLLSTLDWVDQRQAEDAVQWGLEALEDGWEKGCQPQSPLQAALISADPRSGGIRSYVGGRDYAASQFDRLRDAQRQAGSAFKPVVYATALEDGVATTATLLDDAPLTVQAGRELWNPQNSSGEYLGLVSVRTAVEKSLNVPTARLALEAGLPKIVKMARRLGITTRLAPVPALSLGAFEVTPIELATVYATLAGAGDRPQLHGLRAVLDPSGRPLPGEAVRVTQAAISPQLAYLVTSILQGVMDRGTGAGARVQGLRDALAGKTGTTNGRRDSWFAGYSPERVSLVWVGYDDNAETRLSGSRAALPIWARFTYKVRPAGGYAPFGRPAGLTTAAVDSETGELATDRCPEVLTEFFLQGTVPTQVCYLHGGFRSEFAWRRRGTEDEEVRSLRRWLRRVFGRDRPERGAEPEPMPAVPEP